MNKKKALLGSVAATVLLLSGCSSYQQKELNDSTKEKVNEQVKREINVKDRKEKTHSLGGTIKKEQNNQNININKVEKKREKDNKKTDEDLFEKGKYQGTFTPSSVDLNLRDEPSLDSNIINYIHVGETVKGYKEIKGTDGVKSWIYIESGDKKGWISKAYTTKVESKKKSKELNATSEKSQKTNDTSRNTKKIKLNRKILINKLLLQK